jgi:hypothetical protein
MDNVHYLSKEYTHDITIDEVIRIKLKEILKETLYILEGYDSYEMDYAKGHLQDSFTLIIEAMDKA